MIYTSEGKLETLLVSLSCEKILSEKEIKTLGLFRQGYKQLRKSIKENKSLYWNSSEDPEYDEFKSLSPQVQSLLLRESDSTTIDNEIAAEQLKKITSNRWEVEWYKLKK